MTTPHLEPEPTPDVSARILEGTRPGEIWPVDPLDTMGGIAPGHRAETLELTLDIDQPGYEGAAVFLYFTQAGISRMIAELEAVRAENWPEYVEPIEEPTP